MYKPNEQEEIEYLQFVREPAVDGLIDVDQVDGVLEAGEAYEYVDMKDVEQYISSPQKRRYRMKTRPQAATYFCSICNKELKYPSKIKEHMRKHTGEKPFPCHICGSRFSQAHVLKTHLRSHQGEKPFKCSFCDRCFGTVGQKNMHEKCHFRNSTTVRDHDVHVTPAETTPEQQEEQLQEQEQQQQGVVQIYICPFTHCGLQSNSCQEVEDHISEAHGSEVEWNGEFLEGEEYVQHVDGEIQDGQFGFFEYSGETSQNMPSSSRTMNFVHSSVYKDVAPPPTEEVEIESSSQINNDLPGPSSSKMDKMESSLQFMMNQLVDSHYGEKDSIDDCFDDDEKVRVWVDPQPPRKGKREEEEPCLEEMVVDARVLDMAAPKRFANYPVRNRARATRPARNLDWIIDAVAKGHDVDLASPHNRKKPKIHICEFCGKMDKYPSKILAHMRTHTGEKPFKCEICGMSFAQRTPMRLHIRRHLNQRPYVCTFEDCYEEFVSGALLNLHMEKKHYKKRKYVCLKGCGRSFASARNQHHHEEMCSFNRELEALNEEIYDQLIYEESNEDMQDGQHQLDYDVITGNELTVDEIVEEDTSDAHIVEANYFEEEIVLDEQE